MMQIRQDAANQGFAIEGMAPPYSSIQVFNRDFEWSMGEHSHPFYQIIYVTRGTLHVRCGQETWSIVSGQAHVLPAGCSHYLASHGYEQLGIDLQSDDAFRGIHALYRDYIPAPVVIDCPEMLGTVSEIREKVMIGNRVSSALALTLLDTVVLKLLEVHTRAGAERFDRQLSGYINAHMCEGVKLETVAREFHISIPHLERLARKHFGCGVVELYSQRRLSRACILLLSTDLRISEIAEQLGFSAQAHLSAFFKQRTGLSPSAYRDANTYKDTP